VRADQTQGPNQPQLQDHAVLDLALAVTSPLRHPTLYRKDKHHRRARYGEMSMDVSIESPPSKQNGSVWSREDPSPSLIIIIGSNHAKISHHREITPPAICAFLIRASCVHFHAVYVTIITQQHGGPIAAFVSLVLLVGRRLRRDRMHKSSLDERVEQTRK
jgi:hypothetical protein